MQPKEIGLESKITRKMKYISTRNGLKEFNFTEVFIKGLADDGGLYVPKSLKKYSKTNVF